MTNTELLIRTIEQDLTHVHRKRMSDRMGEQYAQLRAERSKAAPDPKRIAALKAAMVQTECDKQDESITVREVLEPLRQQVAEQVAPPEKKMARSR